MSEREGDKTLQKSRYLRHLTLPEVGSQGQERFRKGRVLVVGVGGLGCPASLYLTAAGVGTLGLIDPDRVDFTNLQRQVLFGERDVGSLKVEAAASRLRQLNSEVEVITYSERLSAANALALIRGYDMVLDATDNFAARYLVNDACYLAGRPNIFASVTGFEGRLAIFCETGGPCYRCVFPEPPDQVVLNCTQEGVLGAVPGVMGTLQALLALRTLAGVGPSGSGSLQVWDFISMSSHSLSVPKHSDCRLCGENPSIIELTESEAVCESIPELTVQELLSRGSQGPHLQLIDVREASEFRLGSIPGASSVPLSEIRTGLKPLSSKALVVVFCQTGQRSRQAVQALIRNGCTNVASLVGGLEAWRER